MSDGSIRLYWHRGRGKSDALRQNFGDYLSPLIVEAVSGRRVAYAPIANADMIAIGTILAKEAKAKKFLMKRRLHVWGSGCGQDEERFDNRHYYNAVRGRETLRRIRQPVSSNVALGDPGLLAEMLIGRPAEKKYEIGFVPHYVDQGLPIIREILNLGRRIRLIDVFAPPLEVLKEIASCRHVISSSLHGLVVADAFAVPNIRVRLSSGVIDELKFDDYYSVFDIPVPTPLTGTGVFDALASGDEIFEPYSRPNIDELKKSLFSCFPHL